MQPGLLVAADAPLGGADALQRLVAGLRDASEAPPLIVLHVGAYRGVLSRLLQAKSRALRGICTTARSSGRADRPAHAGRSAR